MAFSEEKMTVYFSRLLIHCPFSVVYQLLISKCVYEIKVLKIVCVSGLEERRAARAWRLSAVEVASPR